MPRQTKGLGSVSDINFNLALAETFETTSIITNPGRFSHDFGPGVFNQTSIFCQS